MFKKPKIYIDKIKKEIKVIANRGANVIISGPVPISMLLLEQDIREVGSGKILDVFLCGLKMTEFMVDCNDFIKAG